MKPEKPYVSFTKEEKHAYVRDLLVNQNLKFRQKYKQAMDLLEELDYYKDENIFNDPIYKNLKEFTELCVEEDKCLDLYLAKKFLNNLN